VLNDFVGERIIQRVTVMGDKPMGVKDPGWEPWVKPGPSTAASRHDRQLRRYFKEKQMK
jgi:taurine dioxygenase